ncbi:MAG: polysaccharide biosynthesis tyrosine autokinase, partial [Desulfobacterales bacterium]|nr:polysaccharide biosynthesis tyrosine autokinase [Desulfobacterales bacterium]
MGKIFDALEKFSKERGHTVSDRIKDSDYEALMQFDDATGKIDIRNPKIARDSIVLKRLKTYRLVNDDGTLTPAGRAKYEELKRKHQEPEPVKPAISGQTKEQAPMEMATPAKMPGGLSASDWALLVNYDRRTGNLLKYDPETGQLDSDSRNILQDPATVQRLIDNQMILPGGWLTPEAKRECESMQEKLEAKQTEKSAKPEKLIAADKPDKPDKAFESPELLKKADMDALLQHDPGTRKLDMRQPAILKDAGIVKRLLKNEMIDAEGKLSPKALVRCRVLTGWTSELEETKRAQATKKQSFAGKIQTAAKKTQIPEASGETDNRKMKIIHLKKDKEKAKKREQPVVEIAEDTEGEKIELHKDDKPIIPEHKPFTFGKTQLVYDQSKIDRNLVALLNPQSFEAEQFKILRTNLLFPVSGKKPRSIMVTSAAPGDGKSFVAANLAVSVATHVNWNVLLVDCDLRRPSVHSQFGFGDVPGLSDYLSNGRDLPSLLLRTAVEHLTILPGGRPPSNPSELLSSERMAAFIDEVAERYNDRLIILDSPPPKLTAESTALARYVDGILLVVKYASTPRDSAVELINKLGKDKILGAIVNNFDAGS